MTPTINQISVAVRVQQLGAGAMQTIQDSLKSVYTAANEQKERVKDSFLLRLFFQIQIYHLKKKVLKDNVYFLYCP